MELSLKTGLILAIAGFLVLILRRLSASKRHLIWKTAFYLILILPLYGFLIPDIEIPLFPGFFSPSESDYITSADSGESSEVYEQGKPTLSESNPEGNPKYPDSNRMQFAEKNESLHSESLQYRQFLSGKDLQHLSIWIFLVWAAGTFLILSRLITSYLTISRVARTNEEVSESWKILTACLASEIGLERTVRITISHENRYPFTFGLIHPTIVLPVDSLRWSPDMRRSVLLHELAHIKNNDLLSRFIVQVTCVLHWFNPLVWFAAHRLFNESEFTCDDLALNTGQKASSYAGHLLAIARGATLVDQYNLAATAMATHNRFKDRIMSILKANSNRGTVSWKTAVAVFVISMLAISPFAAIQPWAKAAEPERLSQNIMPDSPAIVAEEIKLLIHGKAEQGCPILLELKPSASIESANTEFFGQNIHFAEDNGRLLALAAIKLDTIPGNHEIKINVRFVNGEESTVREVIEVTQRFRRSSRVAILSELQPELDDAARSRLAEENRVLRNRTATSENRKYWQDPFIIPATGRLSFAFGEKLTYDGKEVSIHSGADLSMPSGTPLYSSNSGKVVLARNHTLFGNIAYIDHGLGVLTGYTHLSEIAVTEGQFVKKGETIGYSGNTGRSSGPHLHWELIVNGIHCDPLAVLEF